MESLHIPKGVQRVLFRTLNTDRNLMWKKEFDTSYVGFMKDGAQWLVDNTDIKLVGIDYLSVAAFDDLIPSHLVFLENRGCHSCGGPQTGECQTWDILVALPATSVAWSGRFADQMHPYKVKTLVSRCDLVLYRKHSYKLD
uniref:Uncharacterized protein n=1 Tax=Aegilops tauschii subsp. strangulata TaxID=200361 RepID=A0A453L1W9_AEGTS